MDTMTTLNTSYHSQYKQALIDPSLLSEEDLLGLLLKYPYSQPLIFAYERRKKLLQQESSNKELALLYAHSESWLMNYVNKPIHTAAQEIPKITETVLVVENNSTEEGSSSPQENNVEEELVDSNVEEDILTTSEEEDVLEIDRLVHEGGISGDYFTFDSFENREIEQQEVIPAIPAHTNSEDKDDLSLYNDELMPYSFRWWLHKTRLEHAETYQPYAVSNFALKPAKPSVDVSKIEDSILDQQIKENIIHFQDPEEKLSEEVKKKPIVPVPPKKGSDIIEKFIQQDPIIHPPSPENINNENMARQSAEDNYVLVTETLANIYIDQGLNLKAIEVFKKLILKYPEKKSYFATRIEELEKNL